MRNLLATLLLLTMLPALGQELGPPPEAADVERRSASEEAVDETAAPRPPDGFQPENPEVRIITEGDLLPKGFVPPEPIDEEVVA